MPCCRSQANKAKGSGDAEDAHAGPNGVPAGQTEPLSEFDQALAAEGMVAYRNLLGPNQNISHIPGADVEAQVRQQLLGVSTPPGQHLGAAHMQAQANT